MRHGIMTQEKPKGEGGSMKAILFMVLIVSMFSCGIPGVYIDPMPGSWILTEVAGVDYTPFERVYTFADGFATCTQKGAPLGNGFAYSVASPNITITGASEEGLWDNTYERSISSTTMTWTWTGFTAYRFTKQ